MRNAIRGEGSDPRPYRSPADAMLWDRIEALEDLTDVLARCLEEYTKRPLKPGPVAAPRRDTRTGPEHSAGTDEERTAVPIEAIGPPDIAAKKSTVH